ncbi:MAG: 4-hydroxy-tetrahydrodipicolinate synthase [Myxococcaceae bacterium]
MGLVYTALVTPFKLDGSLDLHDFANRVNFQLEAGIHGVVVCGSTGEGITLTEAEKEDLLSIAVKQAAGKASVLMGCGHASTQIACLWQKKAQDLGADAALHVTPWYNKPTPEGLYAHYEAVAQVNHLPIIFYNVPGRTNCNLPIEVIIELAQNFKHMRGLKECNLDPIRLHTLIEKLPSDFKFFSGEDAFILPFMSMGAHGVISIWSNLVPELFVRFMKNPTKELAAKIAFLSNVSPKRPNPIPIKTAMGLNDFRLPLLALPVAEQTELLAKVKAVLS